MLGKRGVGRLLFMAVTITFLMINIACIHCKYEMPVYVFICWFVFNHVSFSLCYPHLSFCFPLQSSNYAYINVTYDVCGSL